MTTTTKVYAPFDEEEILQAENWVALAERVSQSLIVRWNERMDTMENRATPWGEVVKIPGRMPYRKHKKEGYISVDRVFLDMLKSRIAS